MFFILFLSIHYLNILSTCVKRDTYIKVEAFWVNIPYWILFDDVNSNHLHHVSVGPGPAFNLGCWSPKKYVSKDIYWQV